MKILLDSSNDQTFSFVPRSYPSAVNYDLVEEGTKRTVSKTNISTVTVTGFLTISEKFQLTRDKC